MKTIIKTILLLAFATMLHAEDTNQSPWPRTFETSEYEISLYQPQVMEWQDFKLAKVAIAIRVQIKKTNQQTFGTMEIEAPSVADFDERVVHFGTRKVNMIRFPEAKDKAEAAALDDAVRRTLTPSKPLQMSLDDMLANVDRNETQNREIKVNLNPPPIFYAKSPTLLVTFLGKPKFEAIKEIPGTLFAVNTNWDILLDSKTATYYLLAGDFWLSTANVEKGPWSPVQSVPVQFQKLPQDDNWSSVRAKLTAPTIATERLPTILVATEPSELLLTTGEPSLSPISGTNILHVSNTESDVFFHGKSQQFYFLTAGRWFKSAKIEGPWIAATADLPSDFAEIPENDDMAYVLASVKGTAAADEAVILASIPKTATVNREQTQFTAKYEGTAEFISITGSTVKYASNTVSDIFQVENKYYACQDGVWFIADSATGPWIICDSIPAAIYTIPPESPKHNVTYVHVYESTPTTVQVGYTSGYTGTYVSNGLVMFGLGLWLATEAHDHYHGHYYGYGCGAHYNYNHGGYYRGGYTHYGPYGGAGGGAVYNPYTGGYARGGYRYGPNGGGYARGGYNPWTNTSAVRAGGSSPYGSWGRSAVVRDDEWMRTGHSSNWRGSVKGGQTSKGGAALRVDRRNGSDGSVLKTRDGDIYAGRNGNVYKREGDGDWSKRSNGDWAKTKVAKEAPRNWSEKSSRPSKPRVANPKVTRPTTRPATRPTIRPTKSPSRASYKSPQRQTSSKKLDWDSRSRDRSSHQRKSTASRKQRAAPSRSSSRSRGRRR
ncbi:MAG: hypothetical protein ACI9E1_000171 [Cryomorphaceae bacterium]|jgi:hypothetical protein